MLHFPAISIKLLPHNNFCSLTFFEGESGELSDLISHHKPNTQLYHVNEKHWRHFMEYAIYSTYFHLPQDDDERTTTFRHHKQIFSSKTTAAARIFFSKFPFSFVLSSIRFLISFWLLAWFLHIPARYRKRKERKGKALREFTNMELFTQNSRASLLHLNFNVNIKHKAPTEIEFKSYFRSMQTRM